MIDVVQLFYNGHREHFDCCLPLFFRRSKEKARRRPGVGYAASVTAPPSCPSRPYRHSFGTTLICGRVTREPNEAHLHVLAGCQHAFNRQ